MKKITLCIAIAGAISYLCYNSSSTDKETDLLLANVEALSCDGCEAPIDIWCLAGQPEDDCIMVRDGITYHHHELKINEKVKR